MGPELPPNMGMIDTAVTAQLAHYMDKPLPAHVWVVEDMGDDDNQPPWLHLFTEASAAMVVLGHKHKVTMIRAIDVPVQMTWTLWSMDRKLLGVLYYRPVHKLAGIQAISDNDKRKVN